jgi:hypothetical protein
VFITQDTVSSVRLESDENILPYIDVYTEGNLLKIETKQKVNLSSSRGTKIYISAPSLTTFKSSGASNIYTEKKLSSTQPIAFKLSGASKIRMELSSPKVEVQASGAGTIQLSGETKDLIIDGSGSTDVYCFNLMTENAKISLSGAGNAQISASVKLDIHVSGAGDVVYKGNPAVSQSISGAGSVKKVD